MRDLYKPAVSQNIQADTVLHHNNRKIQKTGRVNKTVNKILNDMKGLKEQNTIIDSNNVHVV